MLAALDELTNDNRQKEYYITDIPGIMLDAGEDVRALPVLKPIEVAKRQHGGTSRGG